MMSLLWHAVLGKYLSLQLVTCVSAFTLPIKLNKKKRWIVVQSSLEHIVGCAFYINLIRKAEVGIAF